MSYLPSSPKATLLDRFQARPGVSAPLHRFAHVVMRGPSAFSPAMREAIAARVSHANGCAFCRDAHAAAARALGIGEATLHTVMTGRTDTPSDAALGSVLHYVDQLNRAPAAVTQAHVDAILLDGWPEEAVETLALVCGVFNLMNRWVEGLGVDSQPGTVRAAGRMLATQGYRGMTESTAAAGSS
jgi:AhpD family alkylhydroperoxidase